MPKRTWRHIHARYDQLRRLYFLDGRNVPPTARELDWRWLPQNQGAAAMMGWNEEGRPFVIWIYDRTMTLDADLLHELAHMRLGPKHAKSCMGKGKSVWRREVMRLARAGAPIL